MPVLRPDTGYFQEAVDSILRQTLRDIELVVVEDPSEASASVILRRFEDARIRHVANQQRTSLVDQLNTGLAIARSAFVARMDADDVARSDRLETQLAFLRDNPDVTVVGSQLEVIDPAGRTVGHRAYPTDHADILRAFRRYNALAHPTVVFRKDAILSAGGYELREFAAEDYDLWSRLARTGARFANTSEPLLRYRVHPGASKAVRLRSILAGTTLVKKKYWLRTMSTSERLRFMLEIGLRYAPARLVQWLFVRTHFARVPRPDAR